MTVLSPLAKQKFFDNSGAPAVGYKLFTYAAGTSTKLATYTDSSGGTPNANPIILDYRGEAPIWIPPNVSYKYVFASPTDTDPPGAAIWTIDNIVNSQLVTLYGGVDTGIANAYVLNFTANFTSYTDGIVIYWIPSNANTGASTLNVNGLGAVNITNVDGSTLAANSIVNNVICQVVYKAGSFLLINPATANVNASFVGSLSGMTGTVSPGISYSRVNGIVVLTCSSAATGTSNSTSMSLTTLPSIIRPKVTLVVPSVNMLDNTLVAAGTAIVRPTGVIDFTATFTGGTTSFTAAGSKGLAAGWCIAYSA